MTKFKLFVYSLVVFVIGSIGIITSVSASDEFTIDYDTTYSFDLQGVSTVAQKITLTNNLTGIYAPSFTLTVKGENAENIKVESGSTPLKFKAVKQSTDSTLITIDFENPVTGKGKANIFTVKYTGRPAIKNGQIWEISLAKIAASDTVRNYNLHLVIPKEFGNPAYISPPPTTSSTSDDLSNHTYNFTKDQVINSGVVAGFGNFQTLDFTLSYHLENTDKKSKEFTIALPPDTSLQRVFYEKIDPKPVNVSTDIDGNWLATYKLNGSSSQLIVTSGQVHLLGRPISPSHVKYVTSDININLGPTNNWPVADAKFQTLARLYSTPRTIFDYVVNTFSYDYNRLINNTDRKGAAKAILNPENSICTDFTDVFITISRAAGIPAREHQGFALSNDPKLQPLGLVTDVLHAWPEYWDAKTDVWRSVDPTWTKTTGGANYFDSLDLTHFTFAIHGKSDSQPLPAGMYKIAPNTKDVQVKVGEYQDFYSSPPAVTWNLPLVFIPFWNSSSTIVISNPDGMAKYDLGITLSSQDMKISSVPQVITTLPPFGQSRYDFKISMNPWSFREQKTVYAQVGSHLIAYNIPEVKFYLWYVILIFTGAITILILAILAHRTWHLHLQRSRR